MAPVFPLVLAQKPNGSVLGGGGDEHNISKAQDYGRRCRQSWKVGNWVQAS